MRISVLGVNGFHSPQVLFSLNAFLLFGRQGLMSAARTGSCGISARGISAYEDSRLFPDLAFRYPKLPLPADIFV